MKIDSINFSNDVNQQVFKARIKNNSLISEIYKYANQEEKEDFQKAVKVFADNSKSDVVEFKKDKIGNIEDYSLVNTKDDKKKVLVCKLFPNAICETDGREEYRREHSRFGYVRESLVDTIKEASCEYSNAFFQLFK